MLLALSPSKAMETMEQGIPFHLPPEPTILLGSAAALGPVWKENTTIVQVHK